VPNLFDLVEQQAAGDEPERNVFDQVEEDDAQKDRFLTDVFDGLRQNPEERAAIKEVARRTRAPIDVVEARFPEFKAAAETAAFDPRRFRREYPDLARLALEQPEAGAIALKDPGLPALVRIVRGAFTGWTPPPSLGEEGMRAWKEGGDAALDAMRDRERTDAARAEYEALKPVPMVVDPSADFSWWEKLVGRREGAAPAERPTSIAGHYWDAARGGEPAQVDPRQGARSGPLLPGIVTEKRTEGVLERAFRQGQIGLQRAELGREWALRRLRGEDAWDVEKRVVDLERQLVPRFYGDDIWSKTLAATGQFLPQQIEMYEKAAPAAAAAGLAARAIPATRPIAGKVARAAGAGAGWISTFNAEFGNAVLDYGELRTDAGEGLSDEARIGWGVLYGAVSATVEVATELGPVLGQLGPLGAVVRRGELKAFGAELLRRDPRFRAIVADVAKAYAKGAAGEGLEEFVQQIAQDAIGYLGRVVQAGGTLQRADVAGSVEAAAGAAEQGTLGSLLPGLGRSSVNLATQVAARQSARRGGEALAELMGQGAGPTARYSPEFYAAHARAVTERFGDKVDAFYFDTPEVLRLFQDDEMTSAGIISEEMERASRELMGETGPERLREALATGSKLEVPLEEFAEKWAAAPIAQQLQQHVSAKAWIPTLAQEVKEAEQREAEAKKIADAIEKDKAPPTPDEVALDQLADDLAATGRLKRGEIRDQVKLWRKFLNTTAVRAGVPLAELVEQFEVRVRSAQDLPREAAPASLALTERFLAGPPEARLRTFFVDRNTGVLNRRAFERLGADPARPLVAQVSIEGVKWVNDSGDHSAGNRLYRMAARALQQVAPDVAKVGGDFLVRVKDQAALDALLARAQGLLDVPGFTLTGALGKTPEAASEAHGALKRRLEEDGGRAPRGARPAGVTAESAADVALPEARVENLAIPGDLAATFGRMTDEEVFNATFTDPEAGLLSEEGFFALPPKQHVVAIDLKGFAALNERFGRAFGDALLRAFGQALTEVGGADFDAAHLHGDEYAAQSDDLPALERLLDRLQAACQDVGEGAPLLVFKYGIGSDYEQADRDLTTNRRERAARAEAAGAGAPGDRGRGGLREGRDAHPRGVRRQGFARVAEGLRAARVEQLPTAPIAWTAARDHAKATLAELDQAYGEAAPNVPEYWRATEQLDRAQAELGRLEAGDDKGAPRGWMAAVRRGTRHLFSIVLDRTSNQSTFLHESGHVFMEILAELAERPTATPRLRADWQAALSFVGAKDRADLDARRARAAEIRATAAAGTRELSAEEKAELRELVAPFEKWAKAFERYLMEGKAPSLDLAGAFERFKLWLVSLYRSADALGVPLSDDIRGVFDRLLATDEEIARAQQRAAPQSIFRSPDEAGMSPTEWQAHLARQQGAMSRSAIAARQRAVAERLRVADSWWERERRTRLEEALEEYDALPQAVALRFLRASDPGDNAALAALLEAARERKAASEKGRAPLPHEARRRLDEIEQEIAALEAERRVAIEAERIVAGGEFDLTKARERARARLRVDGDPLVGRSDLYRVGTEVLPTWLSLDEYERDPAAWLWTWAALDVWGKDLDTTGARSKKIDVIARSGKTAPEAAQRLVANYMRRAFEAFPDTDTTLLNRGYLVAQLVTAARGDYMRGLRDQVSEWVKTPPAERRYDDPLSPRQWQFVDRKYGRRFPRWRAETQRGVDREALEKDVGAAPPGDAAIAAQIAELREQQRRAEAEAEKARIAATRARVKLDYAGAIAALDPNVVKTKLRGLTATEDAVSPDELAEMVGAPSGADLLRGMVELPPRREWAEGRADERMRAAFPEVLTEREQLRQIAAEEFHGDAMLGWLLDEWEILRKRAAAAAGNERPGSVPSEALRRAAALLVERMPLQRLDAGRYERAERAAADKAFRAAARRDYAQAYVFQQQRILNHMIFRELVQARADRDRLLEQGKYLAKDGTRARLGKANPALRDGAEQILEALQLGGPFDHPRPPAPLSAVVDAIDATGTTVIFDIETVTAILVNPPPAPARQSGPGERWQGLTVAQARQVLAALANIRAAGTAQLTVLVEGKRLEFAELKAYLIDEAERNLKDRGPPASSVQAESPAAAVGGVISGLDGELLRPEALVSEFLAGNGGIDSWWFRAVVQPLQEAKTREADLLTKTIQPVLDAMEAIPSAVMKRMRERVDGEALFPAHTTLIQPPTRRYELIALALNAGNESNLERLLEGRGISYEELQRALGLLTREELAYVQAVWDAAESLWPLAQQLEERLAGMAPPKIAPRPLAITLEDGSEVHLRGGYFPAVYDRRVDVKGEIQADEVRRGVDFLDPGFVRPGTAHSHLKGRVAGARGVLSLDPTIIQAHLVQVAHDIAFREAVLSVGSIFLDRDIQQVLRRRLGEKKALLFVDWVKDVGRSRAAEAVSQARWWSRVARRLRSNMAVGVLGYAADIVAGDLSNVPVAATQFKDPRHLAAGVAEAVRDPLRARRWALEKFPELRFRADETLNAWRRKRNELTKRRFPGREVLDAYVDHAFDVFEFTDALTATPVAIGAYREGLSLYAGDDAKAVTYAQAMVRKVFPSHSPVDMSALQRDRGFWGSAMLFFGYLNTIWSRRRTMLHEAWQALVGEGRFEDAAAKDRARAIAKVGWRMIALVAAYQILGEWLSGRGKEPDERLWQWLLRKALMGLTVNDLPFGSLAEPIATKIVGGKARRLSVRSAPALAVAEQAGRSILDAFEGDEDAAETFFDLSRSLGIALGIPTRPLRAGEYLYDLAAGETRARPPYAPDVVSGVVYGERERQPANPASTVQDVIEEGF
jgi:GGDEF domain-containing protein